MMFLLALFGCPFVSAETYQEIAGDLDGDGVLGPRFGGPDCRDLDPSVEVCDADGDGVASIAAGGEDCDDSDATVHPGAPEVCNQRDDDCDGAIDNADADVVGSVAFWRDRDGDGAGDPAAGLVCQELADPAIPSSGLHVANDDDCADDDATRGPHADERCDGVDNDCDGVTDDVGIWLEDADGDGFGRDGTQVTGACVLGGASGLAAVGGDCDDGDAAVYPGAVEIPYDGIEQDCDSTEPNDWDVDDDGFVPLEHWEAMLAVNAARPVDQQWMLEPGDCDDTDGRAHVGAFEVCDGVDNDCDGRVDTEDLLGAAPTDEALLRTQVGTWFVDVDGDGHAGTAVAVCPQDLDAAVHRSASTDCFDGQSPAPLGFGGADPTTVHEGMDERCDGVDNDCDGRVDQDFAPFPGSVALYYDADGDGFGADVRHACAVDANQRIVADGGDCNDASASVYPDAPEICGDAVRQDCSDLDIFDCDGDGAQGAYVGGGDGTDCDDIRDDVFPGAALELCDGLDNDCDGLVDSADTDNLDAGSLPFWFPDLDGDGFGVDDGNGIQVCDPPPDRATRVGDCDDADGSLTPETLWYADDDGDGFGDPAVATVQCEPLAGAVLVAGDCNDADADRFPGAIWSLDADQDGSGDPGSETAFCSPPPGQSWVPGPGFDCDDSDTDRGPLRAEIAGNGVDDDCDGVVDNAFDLVWYVDADGDGYGDPNQPATPGPGRTPLVGDCDDSRPNVHTGVTVERCNGLDDNCDGAVLLLPDGTEDPDVGNPVLGVGVEGEPGGFFLGVLGIQGSLTLPVETCGALEPAPDGVLAGVALDLGDRTLPLVSPFHVGTPLDFRVCDASGGVGDLYVRDRDQDGRPGWASLTDLRLVCPGDLAPADDGTWFLVEDAADFDCAPSDPSLGFPAAVGAYVDRDGDGSSWPWALEEPECLARDAVVAAADADQLDCRDHPVVADAIQVPAGELARAVRTCDDGLQLLIATDDALHLDSTVVNGRVRGIRAEDGSLPELVLSGTFSRGVDLELRDLDLRPEDSAVLPAVLSRSWILQDVYIEGMSFVVDGGELVIERSLLVHESAEPLIEVKSAGSVARLDQVRVEARVGSTLVDDDATPLVSVEGGEVELERVTLEGPRKVLAATGGEVSLRHVDIAGSERGLSIEDSASVVIDGVWVRPLAVGSEIQPTHVVPGYFTFGGEVQEVVGLEVDLPGVPPSPDAGEAASFIDLVTQATLVDVVVDHALPVGLVVQPADANSKLTGGEFVGGSTGVLVLGDIELEDVTATGADVMVRNDGGALLWSNTVRELGSALAGRLLEQDDGDAILSGVELASGSDAVFLHRGSLFIEESRIVARDAGKGALTVAVAAPGVVVEVDRSLLASISEVNDGEDPPAALRGDASYTLSDTTLYAPGGTGINFPEVSSDVDLTRVVIDVTSTQGGVGTPFTCASGPLESSNVDVLDTYWAGLTYVCGLTAEPPAVTPLSVDPSTFEVLPAGSGVGEP